MSIITFDTLKLSHKLEKAGFTREQATGTTEALAEAMTEMITDHAITRGDLREELNPIQENQQSMSNDIIALKVELALVKWMVGGTFFGVAMLVIRSLWPT